MSADRKTLDEPRVSSIHFLHAPSSPYHVDKPTEFREVPTRVVSAVVSRKPRVLLKKRNVTYGNRNSRTTHENKSCPCVHHMGSVLRECAKRFRLGACAAPCINVLQPGLKKQITVMQLVLKHLGGLRSGAHLCALSIKTF